MDQGFRSYWAEFLGTFALCFVGQGAICIAQMTGAGPGALLGIAVAHGLALATMISALGATSGAHFNPAVTFGFLLTGRQKLPSAIAYWAAQLLGAAVASLILRSVLPEALWHSVHLGAPAIAPGISVGAAVLIEFILTFFLVTVVWGTAVDERAPRIGGFGIGLAVTMDILVGGPLTGAAMNPARAFGAAHFGEAIQNHWVWWVGPMLGGAVAALMYDKLIMKRA
ncbi:MAG: aquaporin [Candidatus Eisenbacteria bacterium]